jgi:hypothetical protein
MISLTVSGSGFGKTRKFLEYVKSGRPFTVFDRYGQAGVRLLQAATPKDTSETANSWYYRVEHAQGQHILWWGNTHEEDGVNIAIILQYGHGTGTGGYVQGIDYINPALRPLFQKIADDIWREVTNA